MLFRLKKYLINFIIYPALSVFFALVIFTAQPVFAYYGNFDPAVTYFKDSGGTLTASEWNNLTSDFVKTWAPSQLDGGLGIGIAPSTGIGLYSANAIKTDGGFIGSLSATNISAGQFGANTGGGNFSFAGSVGIGTTNPKTKFQISGDNTGVTGRGTFSLVKNEEDYGLFAGVLGNGDAWMQTRVGGSSTYYNLLLNSQGGNVGIGTTIPDAKLSVNGSATFNTGAGMSIGNVGSYNKLITYSSGPVFRIFTGGGYSSFGSGNISVGASYAAISAPTSGLIVEGNVGVGTTNPTVKFQVNGDQVYFTLATSTAATGLVINSNLRMGTSDNYAWIQSHSSKPLVLNLLGNNVGIATTYPSSTLDVNGLIKMRNYTITQPEDVINKAYFDAAVITGTTSVPTIGYWTKTGNNIYSANSGNVGIGTTTPTEKLEINGKLKIGDNTVSGENFTFDGVTATGMKVANSSGYVNITPLNSGWAHIYTDRPNFIFNQAVWTIGGGGFSSYYNENLVLKTGGTVRLTIASSTGAVGIGLTNPSARLAVSSDATIPGIDVRQTAPVAGVYNLLKLGIDDWSLANRGLHFQNWTDLAASRQYILYNGYATGTTPDFYQGYYERFSGIEFKGGDTNFLVNTGASGTGANTLITPTSAFSIKYTGNIGIGTIAPGYSLDVNTATGDAYDRLQATSSTQNVGLALGRNGVNQWYMYSPANTTDFRISGFTATDPFAIKGSNGYVGVGTTNPLTRFVVGTSSITYIPAANYYNSALISGHLELDGTLFLETPIASQNGINIQNLTLTSDPFTSQVILGYDYDTLVNADKKYTITLSGGFSGSSANLFDGNTGSALAGATGNTGAIEVNFNGMKHYFYGLVLTSPWGTSYGFSSSFLIEKYYDPSSANGWDANCDNSEGDLVWGTIADITGFSGRQYVTRSNLGNGICKLRVTFRDVVGTQNQIQVGDLSAYQFYSGYQGLNAKTNGDTIYGAYNFTDGTTNRVHIDNGVSGVSYFNGGNVGIGTVSPGAKLDIISPDNTAQASQLRIGMVSDSYGKYTFKQKTDGGYANQYMSLDVVDNTGTYINNMVWSRGKIGIGTTSLATASFVVGTSTSNYSIDAGNYRVGNVATPISNLDAVNLAYVNSIVMPSSTSTPVGTQSGFWTAGASNSIYNNNTGNVGIGITNPTAKLEVAEGILEISGTTAASHGILMDRGPAITTTALQSSIFTEWNGLNNAESMTSRAWAYKWQKTDGTNWMVINNSGNLGIGTTNPTSILEIGGNHTDIGGITTRAAIVSNSNSIQSFQLENLSTGNAAEMRFVTRSDDGNYMAFTSPSSANTGTFFGATKSTGNFIFSSNRPLYIGTISDSDILFGRNNSSISMVIKGSTSNVGIGYTSPGYILDTNTATGDAYNRFMSTDATQNVGVILGRNGLNQWYMYSPANTTDFRISGLAVTDPFTIKDTTGYVGVGTTNPTSLLHVQGNYSGGQDNSIPQMKIVNSATSSSYAFIKTMVGTGYVGGYPEIWMQAGNSSVDIRGVSNHDMKFWTNNAEKMRLTSGGNVGIGTTSPFTKLQVFGGAAFGNGVQTSFLSGADFQIQKNNGNNTVLGMWQYGVASSLIGNKASDANFYLTNNYYGGGIGVPTTSIAITKDGLVGIGTIAPSTTLQVIGTVTATAFSGSLTSLLNAANISAGIFGSNAAFGNYAFSDKLSIGWGTSSSPTTMSQAADLAVKTYLAVGATSTSGAALKVVGDTIITGSLQTQTGADFAEEFSTDTDLEPGTVVVMGNLGYKSVKPCEKSSDSTVVGIVSDNPSIIAGKVDSKNKAVVAMMGVVKVKATSANGKIKKGDLLTTSDLTGYAEKSSNIPGTVIGKALENLNGRRGEIKVLVNLQ